MVKIAEPPTESVDFRIARRLTPRKITAKVIDARGAPVADAWIAADPHNGDYPPTLETGAGGSVTFEGFEELSYQLSIGKDDLITELTVPAAKGAAEFSVTLLKKPSPR